MGWKLLKIQIINGARSHVLHFLAPSIFLIIFSCSNSGEKREDLRKSSPMRFFADREICYADILPPSEVIIILNQLIIIIIKSYDSFLFFSFLFGLDKVRARIEVAVLNFLKILTCTDPAISDLLLV
jgi:meiotic recombination protein SPO11